MLLKRLLVALCVCLVLLTVVAAYAYTVPGVTFDDFSARLDDAFTGFQKELDIQDADLSTTADGYTVFVCKINDATLTTTEDPTGVLRIVELSFPYYFLDDMMVETSAVVSSFYTDFGFNARLNRTTSFLDRLAVAITNSPGLTTQVKIEGYTLTFSLSGSNIVYTFSLDGG